MQSYPLLVVLAVTFSGMAAAPTPVLNLDNPASFETVADQLAAKRVVFVGETHDRYDHHLNQLEIIRGMHQRDPKLAIGVEYFPQQMQPQLDDYIEGRTTEEQFLRATDYFKTWGYDYRLYQPIFRFAREQRIPVRALNVPAALVSAVAENGLTGVPEQQRALLPEVQPADEAYKARLRPIFAEHGSQKPGSFDHFVEAQLVWDEGMATSAAAYLNANPGRRMVILAGSGHVVYGAGIPSRLERRTHATYSIVLGSGEAIEPGIADFILLSRREELPPPGILGASLKEEKGECRIESVIPGGAAEKAGLRKGDVLVEVGGQPVKSPSDARLVLWDKKPGDRVHISVRHGKGTRDLEVELAARSPHGAT